MFAFIDETGNTGANVFDEHQPDFYTAALITKSDFDIVYGPAISRICADNGLESIHASESGFRMVESIAPKVLRIFKNSNAHFFLSRVEKKYLVSTKIYDTFFDSGENPSVPWSAYNIRPMRLILAFKVAAITTDEIARRFWEILMEKNEDRAREMLPTICQALLENVHFLPDQRSRDIIGEALSWAETHPEALHIQSIGKIARNGHMPNMVAFANLLDGLENFSKRWERQVRRITHDRQSQFDKTLKEWHRLHSNASDQPIRLPGETLVFQKVVGSSFEVKASNESPGIQAIDLVLWLYQQFKKGNSIPRNSGKLLNFVFRRAWQSDFSFDGVSSQVQERFGAILNTPLTDEKMAEAQKMLNMEERNRQALMSMYEKDGIVPYMRSREITDEN